MTVNPELKLHQSFFKGKGKADPKDTVVFKFPVDRVVGLLRDNGILTSL